MHTYYFHGRVIPLRADVFFNTIRTSGRTAGKHVDLEVSCYHSEFQGTIKTPSLFDDVFDLEVHVELMMRNVVDRLSYLAICAYDFELVGAVMPNGDPVVFAVSEAVLKPTVEEQWLHSKETIPFLDDIIFFRFNDVGIDQALRCFNHAMRDKTLTTLFCYLAIEVVARRCLSISRGASVTELKATEWAEFRGLINLLEATIKGEIKTLADKFRHGNFDDTSWGQRKSALSLAWEVIRRAIYYCRTKSKLPETEFPFV